MADQKRKTQAEKAAISAKQKKASASAKPSADKNKKNVQQAVPAERLIATRYIVAGVCLALFVLFLVISLGSEGALLKICENLVLGLLGKGGQHSCAALYVLYSVLQRKASCENEMRLPGGIRCARWIHYTSGF